MESPQLLDEYDIVFAGGAPYQIIVLSVAHYEPHLFAYRGHCRGYRCWPAGHGRSVFARSRARIRDRSVASQVVNFEFGGVRRFST